MNGKHLTISYVWQTKLSVVLVFASCFMALGCCKSFDPGTRAEDLAAREWLRDWPGSYDWTKFTRGKSVPESEMQRAEMLLQHEAAVRITTSQARDLVGNVTLPDGQGEPYLLRAVGDRVL